MLAILSVLLYQVLALLEERELRERFGRQGEAYARAVPRFPGRLRRNTEP